LGYDANFAIDIDKMATAWQIISNYHTGLRVSFEILATGIWQKINTEVKVIGHIKIYQIIVLLNSKK
jgi:hypothetical protein